MATVAYRWTCFACEHANEPHVPRCTACGFAALATAAEIDAVRGMPVRTAMGPRVRRRSAQESLGVLLGTLSPWRKGVAVLGLVGVAGGALGIKAFWSLAVLAWSVGFLATGLALCGLAFSGPKQAPRSPDEAQRNPGPALDQ